MPRYKEYDMPFGEVVKKTVQSVLEATKKTAQPRRLRSVLVEVELNEFCPHPCVL
jgi:hypothetical protein